MEAKIEIDKTTIVQKVMNDFNFHKVQRLMYACDWVWANTWPNTPSVKHIREEGVRLLERAIDLFNDCEIGDQGATVQTGGLSASCKIQYEGGVDVELKFIAEAGIWNTEWENEENENQNA